MEVKIFFDASALVAASKSSQGGSASILDSCKSERGLQALATIAVQEETVRNLSAEKELRRFNREIGPYLGIVSVVTPEEMAEYAQLIHKKDAHVLAGAIKGKASILLTLDTKHFKTSILKNTKLPIVILSPKEFLQRQKG